MRKLLAVMLIMLVPVVGWCQANSDARNITRNQFGGQKWAILIGIDDYIHVKDLHYCGADMRALRDRLVASGFPERQVKLLHDDAQEKRFLPFKANIEQQIDLVLNLAGKEDMVVLAFSGHGAHLQGGSYLCPTEARLGAPETLISLDKIYGQMKNSAAALKLVLVDACRNDPQVGGQKTLTESTRSFANAIQRDRLPEGLILLNSCTAGEVSWEDEKFGHGVFMHFLLEGLDGKADGDKNGNVTLNELSRYASLQTKVYVADRFTDSQRPFLRGDLTVEALEFSFGTIGGGSPDGTKAGEVRKFNEELSLEMVWCPPGQFTMGSPPSEQDRSGNEDQVAVTLTSGFWLGRTEVTQGQWQAVMGTEPWKGQDYVREGSDYPATYVSWEDAVKFCEALTTREIAAGRLPKGLVYQLPTEAQWEYACRAGTTSSYSFGDDASRLGEYAWFDANAWDIDEKYAHRVGTKRENAWHLYDMHGNLWEWCRDWYEEKLPGGRAPLVSTVGSFRVLRGGSWFFSPQFCRSAYRDWYSPSSRDYYLGFRVSSSVK